MTYVIVFVLEEFFRRICIYQPAEGLQILLLLSNLTKLSWSKFLFASNEGTPPKKRWGLTSRSRTKLLGFCSERSPPMKITVHNSHATSSTLTVLFNRTLCYVVNWFRFVKFSYFPMLSLSTWMINQRCCFPSIPFETFIIINHYEHL